MLHINSGGATRKLQERRQSFKQQSHKKIIKLRSLFW